jgi:hypothetical protein
VEPFDRLRADLERAAVIGERPNRASDLTFTGPATIRQHCLHLILTSKVKIASTRHGFKFGLRFVQLVNSVPGFHFLGSLAA